MNRVSTCSRATRRSAFVLGTVLCGFALLNGVGRTPVYVPLAKAQEAVPNPAPAEDAVPADTEPPFAPIAYFAQNCARCHGPNGSFYGTNFGKNLTDNKLRTVVHDMAAGPGNAPLTDHALKIEVAYHRALIAKQPFIVVTEVTEKDGVTTLHGEVTPESTLTLTSGQAEVPVKVEDAVWEVVLPPKTTLGEVTLVAVRGEVKTMLQVSTQLWSHGAEAQK